MAHLIISLVLTLWLGATVVQSMGFHVVNRTGLLLLLALASLSHLSLTTAYPAFAGGSGRRTAHIRTGPHPGAKYNILQKATSADVVMDPYPYIVIEHPLPDDVYDELEREYPTDSEIAKHATGYAKGPGKGKEALQNIRYDIRAITMLHENHRAVRPVWTRFVEYHVSNAFYHEVVRVFGDAIRQVRPDLLERPHPSSLSEMKIKLRGTEDSTTDLSVDCQVGMNSPLEKASPLGVRGPHHDALEEIWGGLFYLKHDDDQSDGAALQVLKCAKGLYACKEIRSKSEKIKLGMSPVKGSDQFNPNELQVTASVPYAKNVFAMFINTNISIHSVTPRTPGPFSRRLVNIIGRITQHSK